MTTLERVRLGGRNFLRPGDPVKVKPSRPGRRDGFVAKVRRIEQLDDGSIQVEVAGAPLGRPVAIRTFRLERLARVVAAKVEQR